ncbi:MAG TPA: hypothetical protein VK459_16140, partial [Polyangiaceae bacterium]|nr:hypothetical protein [Polyangiaceae bacterium]
PAGGLFADDLGSQDGLAREVAASIRSGVAASAFHTGSARFDGEWAFGTFTMAALGLGHVVLEHPERRDDYVPVMERCADELVSKGTNAFGTEAWGDFGFEGLPGGRGHGYLGYSNLALSMIRLVNPDTRHAKLHADLTEALARRLEASPHGLFETYPGEAYPADMAMVAGSIALHDCATGAPDRAFWPAWREAYSKWIEPGSGLLRQSGAAGSGGHVGPARSSGTALAAFALSFVDRELSRRLFEGLRRSRASVLGFGAILEYPPGEGGVGDIDSGPVVFGAGVSATGFTLSSAKLHGDEALFTELYRTADLFGAPVFRPTGVRFMSGGPLGNSILLAMTTATWAWQKRCKNAKPQMEAR